MAERNQPSPAPRRGGAILRRAALGMGVAVAVLAATEGALRRAIPEAGRPPPIDRFALADVATGAYVHRRDTVAGAWLEAVEGRVRTRPSRRPEGVSTVDVPAQPDPGVHRIVALGGSTTRGVPFDHLGGGFVAQMEGVLARTSETPFEVINLGVPGMDARGVARMAVEAQQLHAATWVVYTGNNEVVGDLLDRCVRSERLVLAQTLDRLLGYRLLRARLLGTPAQPTAADALAAQEACMGARIAEAWSDGAARTGSALDAAYAPGVEQPLAREDAVAKAVDARLRRSLDRILAAAEAANARVVLALPVTNLAHGPEHPLAGPGRTSEDAARVDRIIERARQASGTIALEMWTAALRLDPHRADALHGWGLARLRLGGDPTSAVTALRAAVDHDYSSRRPTRAVQAALTEACAHAAVTCIELDGVLSQRARRAIVPADWFADHCHPSEVGTEQIGAVLAAAVLDGVQR